MLKKFKTLTKALSVFLAILLVIQMAPMQAMAEALKELLAEDETVSDSYILCEDISKRDEYVKHFRLADGSFQAVQYDVPVHYQSGGVWVEYDNTLVEVDASDEENEGKIIKNKDLTNTLADFSVRFSKKTNGHKFVRLTKDGYSISWYYVDAKKQTAQVVEKEADNDVTTLENITSQVVYENIYKDTDLEYLVSSEGIKENIILNSAKAPTEYVAEYKANGLTPVQIDNKTIELQDSNGVAVYTLYAPYMYDAANEYSQGIYITLSDVKNGKFTVTTTLDAAWIQDEARTFPVVADPLLESSQLWTDNTHCHSAYIASSTPDATYGRGGANYEGSLYVGKIAERGKTRALIKNPVLPELGVADTVVHAEMAVYVHTCYPQLVVSLHRVTSDWEQNTVCWNSNVQYDSAIVDYQTIQHIEKTTQNATRWQRFEITELVQGWYSGEYENYGVMLYSDKENGPTGSGVWMFSSGYTSATGARPVLVVTYRNTSGYEGYYSYTSMSAGRDGTASVNNYNGNLVFSQPLTLDNGGNLMPVSVSLVYNANGTDSPYTFAGKNVQTNYHVYLRYDSALAENGYKYYLNDSDGTRHWFYFEDEATTGKDEDGLGYTLDLLEDSSDVLCPNAKYRITDKNKNKMFFDADGNLMQITNSNGVSSTVQYEIVGETLRIKSVTDGAGRIYNFAYDETSPEKLISVTDPSSRKTELQYTSELLTGVKFPDSEVITIEYDATTKSMVKINAIDGTQTSITYDESVQHRVESIAWGTSTSNLEKYTFSYKQNETKITDIQNRSFTYQFNDWGQTTGVVSNSIGTAQFIEYYDKGDSKADPNTNKILASSKVLTSVTNLMVNPSFTRDYSNGYSSYIQSETDAPTVSVDTTKGNFTNNALKVYKPATNTGSVLSIQELATLEAGEYTLSGYVNTDGATLSGDGLALALEIWENDACVGIAHCEKITSTDEWQRISVTVTLEEGQSLKVACGFYANGSGTAWFDDLQLEKGTGVSSFNLLENSAITNSNTCWTSSATVSTLEDDELNGYSNAISINGSPTAQNAGISQTIYTTNGQKDDVYCLGAWIKADSAPINDLKSDDTYIPRFSLALNFYNEDDECVGAEEIDINADVDTWQFVTGKVIAPEAYTYVKFEVIYYCNVNSVSMTGAMCYREAFGNTYTYDDNGNVVSSVDLAETNSTFMSKSNQLVSMLNPSGSKYYYSYDYNDSDLLQIVSTDGQRYSFTYDSNGNVLSAKIEADKSVTSITSGSKYIIRNVLTGNVIDSGDDSGIATNWRYREANTNQIWEIISTDETDVYYIKNLSAGEKYLAVKDNSNTDNADLVLTSTLGGDECKFKLQPNGDGTFTIYTKTSNFTKCIDALPGDNTSTDDGTPLKQYTFAENDKAQQWYLYVDITSASGATQKDYMQTTATYTESGNFVSSQTDINGNTTSYSYNETTGRLESVTDSKGVTTNYAYDNNTNNLLSITTGGIVNSYLYTKGRLSLINVNNSVQYKFNYDSYGRATSIQYGNGETFCNLSTNEYTSSGLLNKFAYGNGDYTQYEYDNLDRLTEISYNGSSKYRKTYYYGTDGNLSHIVDHSVNSYTRYVYDFAGRLASSREYVGTSLSGNTLLSSIDYIYADKTNYLTGINYFSALGTQTIGFTYGDLALGQMPDQVYSVSWNGVERLNRTYDDLGRLSSINIINRGAEPIFANTTTSFTYYDIGETNKTTSQVKSISTAGITHSYTYDSIGNISSIYDGSRTTTYEYDSLNQLVRANNPYENKTYTYEYVNGNITYEHIYTYTTGELPATPLMSKQYHYDNPVWGDVLTGVSEITYSSNSASAYSLRNENAFANQIFGDREYTALNFNNNIFSSNISVASVNTNTTTNNITVDEIGNMLTYKGVNYQWNGRQLLLMSTDELVLSYEYNMDGQRVKKTLSAPTGEVAYTYEYFYCGDILAGEIFTANPEYFDADSYVLTYMFDESGDYFGFTYNGTPYYYVKNLQNDVYLIIDENGVAQVLYQYDAWGNVVGGYDASTDGLGAVNPITYRSYHYEHETGYYFLTTRYYSPELHRFINADDSSYMGATGTVLGNNLFSYCENNPIIFSDPQGTFLGALIGGVVGAVAGAVSAALEGENIAAGAAIGAATGAATGLIVDAVVATGGAAAVVGGALLCGAVAAGGEVARQVVNHGEIVDTDAVVLEGVCGTVGGLFSMALAGVPLSKVGGKIVSNMKANASMTLFEHTIYLKETGKMILPAIKDNASTFTLKLIIEFGKEGISNSLGNIYSSIVEFVYETSKNLLK